MADVDISSISFGDTTYNLKDPSKYEKPAGGIPYSHLEAGVRASLDKADSALQEHQSLAAYRASAAQDVIDAGKLSVSSKGVAGGVAELDANGKVPVAQCPIEEDVAQATTDWLDEHIVQETGYVLDDTLTVSGAAADAKKTGDELSNLKSALQNQLPNAFSRTCNANEFKRVSINISGEETNNTVTITSYCYFNKSDSVTSIESANGFVMRPRAWDASGTFLGYLKTDGTFGTSGDIASLTKFNFLDYPDYFFRICVVKPNESGYATITTSAATNITITYVENKCSIIEPGGNNKRKLAMVNGADAIRNRNFVCQPGYPNRGFAQIDVPTTNTIFIDPGSGKFAYRIFSGVYGSITEVVPSSDWISQPTALSFSYPQMALIKFANQDDTTPFNVNTFDGGAYMSLPDAKDPYTLYGKRLSVMGDSISSFTGYISPGSTAFYPRTGSNVNDWRDTYWGALAYRNDMVVDTIDAYSGSCVATKWQDDSLGERISFIENSRLSRLGTPDIIIVQGGANDFGGNPLGNYPSDGTYSNLYEFRTAYAYLLDQLKQRYPNAKIVCLSLMTMRDYNNTQFPEKQTAIKQTLALVDAELHYLYEFNQTIKELTTRYECLFCDITDLMNYYVSSTLGVHPTAEVHAEIANRIEQVLK